MFLLLLSSAWKWSSGLADVIFTINFSGFDLFGVEN